MLEVSQFNGFSTGRSIVSAGLVLELDAGNTGSYPGTGTTWTDLSGNGLNGTLTNGPTFSTTKGGSIVFDGTNDYVAPTSFSDSFLQNNWTISFWVNFDAINAGSINDRTLLQHGSSATRSGLHLCERSTKILFGMYADDLTSNQSISISTWYNLVFTINNSTFLQQIYINGSLDNSRTAGGAYIGSGSNARICGAVIGFGLPFDGFMSLCTAYNRVLTTSEIQQNFNALRGRFGV